MSCEIAPDENHLRAALELLGVRPFGYDQTRTEMTEKDALIELLPDVEEIDDRDPSDDHTVNWGRVRGAIRAARPVRTLTVIVLGSIPATMWASRVAEPMSASLSVHAAVATAVMASSIAAVGAASGGRTRRWACAALLVAAIGGTLIADPTRHLVAAWIVGA